MLKPGGLFVFIDSLQMGDKPGWDGLLEAFPHRFHEPYYRHYSTDDLDGMFQAAGLEADMTIDAVPVQADGAAEAVDAAISLPAAGRGSGRGGSGSSRPERIFHELDDHAFGAAAVERLGAAAAQAQHLRQRLVAGSDHAPVHFLGILHLEADVREAVVALADRDRLAFGRQST